MDQSLPSPEEPLDYRRLAGAAVLAAFLSALANTALFFAARLMGAFPAHLIIPRVGHPLTLPPVLVSSILGVLGGALTLAFLGKLVPTRPRRTFRIVAVVVLILSFGSPFTIPNGTALSYGALLAMHLVTAAISVLILTPPRKTLEKHLGAQQSK